MLHEQDGSYYFTASNNESQMTVSVDLLLMDGKFKSLCINPKSILPALSLLPEQPLNITVDDASYAVKVEYLGGAFNFVALPSDEFPNLEGVKEGEDSVSFSIAGNVFLPCITAASQSTSADELRPTLGCVCLDVKEDGVIVVGSDGHKLYKYAYLPGAPFGRGTGTLLIHESMVSGISHAFRTAESVSIKSNGRQTEISSDSARFILRNVEGRFPNYASVIPPSQPYHITVAVKPLLSALKRLSLFASANSCLVKISVSGKKVSLYAEDVDFSTSSNEALDIIESVIPDDFAFGIKGTTLLQFLAFVGTDNVRICLTDPSRAVVLKEDDAASPLTLLLMPMMLSE